MKHLVYHKDPDGYTSAAIARLCLEGRGQDSISFHPINYGEEFPDFSEPGEWYVLDFSFQPLEKMSEIADQLGDHLTWIDHHATVIDAQQEFPNLRDVRGIRKSGKAACVLTWEYFHKGIAVPRAVELIGKFDVWDRSDETEWENEIRPVVAYLQSKDIDPQHTQAQVFWNRFLKADGSNHWQSIHDRSLNQAIDEGMALKNFQDRLQAEMMKGLAYTGKFAGHRAAMVNNNSGGSLKFEQTFYVPDFELLVGYAHDGKSWSVGLYTAQAHIHCGRIAEKLGRDGPFGEGGGHAGAAGFRTDWEHLEKLIECDD